MFVLPQLKPLIMNRDLRNAILFDLGLNPVTICKSPDFNFGESEEFFHYTSKEYLCSQLRETDEVYNIHESVLLHKKSGLRIKYTSHENYAGDEVEYKVIELFVIDLIKNEINIENVDFKKRQFATATGIISFDEVQYEFGND